MFGSAGVIGNPMGFARSLGLGIRDFLSVPARSVLQVMQIYSRLETCLVIRMFNLYIASSEPYRTYFGHGTGDY